MTNEANPVLPDPWADYPRHYIEARDATMHLGWSESSRLETVVEFNTWPGKPDGYKDVDICRRTALLDTDLDVVAHVMTQAAKGDPAILDALLRQCGDDRLGEFLSLPSHYGIVLSYDFFRREPYFKVTWNT